MAVETLSLSNFRNIAAMQLQLVPGFNLVTGVNGAGKTSLLEAIFVVARGRSFRSTDVRQQIRKEQHHFELVVRTDRGDMIGMRRSPREVTVRCNGETVRRLSEIAERLPVFAITPRSHELIEGIPETRRRFLDWGMFHVEHGYGVLVQRYNKVLRQRNAALRSADNAARHWDQQLIDLNRQLTKRRQDYVDALGFRFENTLEQISDIDSVSLAYHPGWQGGLDTFEQVLSEKFALDLERGFTSVGLHRGDLQIRFANRTAKDAISRGQQKMLAIALLVAQIELIADAGSVSPVLLIDDIPSELDRTHMSRLLDYLARIPAQKVMTAIDAPENTFPSETRMFHVEHGALSG